MAVKEVELYLDYKLDESYTPKKISIRSGSTVHDLKEIHAQNITEPTGWVSIPLNGIDTEVCAGVRPMGGQLLITLVPGATAHFFLADCDHRHAPERKGHAHSTSQSVRAP